MVRRGEGERRGPSTDTMRQIGELGLAGSSRLPEAERRRAKHGDDDAAAGTNPSDGVELAAETVRENLQDDLLGPALGCADATRGMGTIALWLAVRLSFKFEELAEVPRGARGSLGGPGAANFRDAAMRAEAASPPEMVHRVRRGAATGRPLTLMSAAATGLQDLLPGSVARPAAGIGEGGGGAGSGIFSPGPMALIWRNAAGFSCSAFRNAPCSSKT